MVTRRNRMQPIAARLLKRVYVTFDRTELLAELFKRLGYNVDFCSNPSIDAVK